ncbi:hypothetical protein BH10ACI2_BH10ACI2_07920 [soil metagenome]
MLPKLFVFLCLFGSSIAAQSVSPSPTPVQSADDVVKISTNLIQLDVTVTDSKGKVVTDLRPDDIEIYENGQKQKIKGLSFISSKRVDAVKQKTAPDAIAVPVPSPRALQPENVRRTIALVVDDLSLSFESAAATRRALKKFVDDQMQEGDLVAIIRTGSGIGSLQQFTSDKAMLTSAIERVRWNPIGNGGLSAFAPLEPSFADQTAAAGGESAKAVAGSAAAVQKSFESFQTSTFANGTLESLRFIVSGMSEMPGRKSVLLFSDGWTMFNVDEHGFTEAGSRAEFLKRLVDLANRSSVVFYTIDARGLQYTGFTAADHVPTDPRAFSAALSARSTEFFFSQAGLSYLADETGGSAYMNRNDIAGGIRKALEDQSYYLLAYEPDTDTFDAKNLKYNKIEIKVSRPGLIVRHRSGFFNKADEAIGKPDAGSQSAGMQLLTAMKSPFVVNGITLSMNALFGSDKSGAYVQSLLHIDAKDLKFTDESDGSKKVVFDVWAVGLGDNGTPGDQIKKTYTLTLKPEKFQKVLDEGFVYFFVIPVKKPGGYQYRVVIRDTQSGKIGTASQFVLIPDLKKGRLTASSMVIESHSPEEWAKPNGPNGGLLRSISQTDTALRRIKLGTVLEYGFDDYNAKLNAARKTSLQSRIRVFRDGELVLDGQPVAVDPNGQTDPQRIQLSGAVSLNGKMLPGDYILQVIVTDALAKKNDQIISQYVQFELVQ